MNIGGLFGALTPVFFVLALGYLAGKRNTFDADQSAGLSKLALTFALPASLFVSMTDIPKDLLLQQGRLVLALILSHAGLLLAAWLLLRRAPPLLPSAWEAAVLPCGDRSKILHEGVRFIEQGSEPDPQLRKHRARSLARALRKLGYNVAISPMNPATPEDATSTQSR
jgi:hypothetical protein